MSSAARAGTWSRLAFQDTFVFSCPHIFQPSPGLELLPLFAVLHVQLMFFIINASQNLQSAPDLHIKETH